MNKRKLTIYEWQRVKGQTYLEKVAIGPGTLHQLGIDYTAIVEMPDGSLKNIPVELVMFETV